MDDRNSPTTARIMETIETHLTKVRKAGPNNIVSLCPFHDDHSPSFSMNIHNGLFLCYSCGVKGTFRSFLTQLGMTPEQIRRSYGRTLEDIKRNEPPAPDPRKPGLIVTEEHKLIPEDLLGIFHRCPEQLLDEGFEEDTLKDFQIGMDLVHQRITFPLRDLRGKLVGISGRATDDERQESRYKVYREEYRAWELPPYDTDKNHFVWNAHRVYAQTLRTPLPAPKVLVEGFKACMWLTQAGIANVVALMGKSMSWEQGVLLKRMGGPYIVWPDNDEPGIDGAITICNELRKFVPFIKVVEYDARQPTDVPLEDVLGLIQTAASYDDIALS